MRNRRHPGKCGEFLGKLLDSAQNTTFVWGALAGSNRLGGFPVFVAFVVGVVCLPGCSTGAKTNNSETPLISVSLTQTPPASMPIGGTATVSATVSNDIANAGVNWAALCGSAPTCGSFSPAHTASGGNSTFTAPRSVPKGNTVSVTAMSTTDLSKTFSATVTITSTVSGVTITQAPPATFPSEANLSVAAVVAGDPNNEGVDWSATCGGISCTTTGSFGFVSGTHSAQGTPITFTVPGASNTFPTIVGTTVILTATSTTDSNFSASVSFVVAPPISIRISQAPPTSLATNATAQMIAVVSDDPTHSGVTWSIQSCEAAPCGSWAGATSGTVPGCVSGICVHTASGAAATYIAPASGQSQVTLEAIATASPNTVATVTLSVTAPISIAITQGVVNSSIVINATSPLVATVSNDIANAGVDWSVTCGSPGDCGSFSPAHTASGDATTYTAPTAVPTGSTVTITATSTSDPTKTASQTVTVTASIPPNSLLSGQFVLYLAGSDTNGGPYTLGGVIVADGLGHITTGSLDIVDSGGTNAGNAPVLASTYSIGADGRGQIQLQLNTRSPAFGGSFGVKNSGLITLSIVFVSSKHALLSETDTFGTGTGTLDLQSASDLAAFTSKSKGLDGLYSLRLVGTETANPDAAYFVAAAWTLTFNGTTYGETAYISDQSDQGVITSVPFHTISLPFSSPLPNAFGEMQLNSVNLGLPTQFSLDLWLIDANHFVITDWRDSFVGTPAVIVIGNMVAQPYPPTITGTFAFTATGQTALPSAHNQVAGGVFTCGSTGLLDVTPLGGTPVNSQAIDVSCGATTNGRALIALSGTGTTGISRFAAYPTYDQGIYLIELDGGSSGTSGPSGEGDAMQQTIAVPISSSAFKGTYGSSFLANTSLGLQAFAAEIDSDGVSALAGTGDLSSFVTTPPSATPSTNATLTGSFTAAADGRFPLTLTLTPATGQPTPQLSTINGVCYIVSSDSCLVLSLDASAPGTGVLQLAQTGL